MSRLISEYIDDELDLDRKIRFVEITHADEGFKDEALSLLRQEKVLRGPAVDRAPEVDFELQPLAARPSRSWLRPAGAATGWLAAAAMVAFLLLTPAPAPNQACPNYHRFVLYQPDAGRAEISGTFTGWTNTPMIPTGQGYWSARIELPPGEHRFVYIIDGARTVPDPTVPLRERDDFGNVNSILMEDI
jgi:hypothetical protein